MKNISKGGSLIIVLLTYIAAFAVCYFCYDPILEFTKRFLYTFFALDIIATLVVWIVGLIFKNASMYDPYWSVVPVVMVVIFTYEASYFNPLSLLFIAVIAIWGIRLTANWIVDWPGLKHQDWRYSMLKEKCPKLYFFTNLIGINMIPTGVVFAAMIPMFFAIQSADNINVLTIVGAAICIFAALLQLVADGQMRRFRKGNNKGKVMQRGLWKYSRHPNYFGEISFWWGIFIMQFSVLPRRWYLIAGPIIMTLLFFIISIPMMKRKLLNTKKGYSEYVKTTSMLIPLPRKR